MQQSRPACATYAEKPYIDTGIDVGLVRFRFGLSERVVFPKAMPESVTRRIDMHSGRGNSVPPHVSERRETTSIMAGTGYR